MHLSYSERKRVVHDEQCRKWSLSGWEKDTTEWASVLGCVENSSSDYVDGLLSSRYSFPINRPLFPTPCSELPLGCGVNPFHSSRGPPESLKISSARAVTDGNSRLTSLTRFASRLPSRCSPTPPHPPRIELWRSFRSVSVREIFKVYWSIQDTTRISDTVDELFIIIGE